MIIEIVVMSERHQQAKDNRLLMPVCSAFIDSMREEFGADQVKVTYAAENGIELGKPGRFEEGMKLCPPADMTIGQQLAVVERNIGMSS